MHTSWVYSDTVLYGTHPLYYLSCECLISVAHDMCKAQSCVDAKARTLVLHQGTSQKPVGMSFHAGVGAGKDNVVPGLYVCGWLKRGPTGIIGTNLTDAEDTVVSMARDYCNLQRDPAAGRAGLQRLLLQRGVSFVDWDAWENINHCEQEQGQSVGAARVKCTSVGDLLRAAKC